MITGENVVMLVRAQHEAYCLSAPDPGVPYLD
jgi:hypothetical protein